MKRRELSHSSTQLKDTIRFQKIKDIKKYQYLFKDKDM